MPKSMESIDVCPSRSPTVVSSRTDGCDGLERRAVGALGRSQVGVFGTALRRSLRPPRALEALLGGVFV